MVLVTSLVAVNTQIGEKISGEKVDIKELLQIDDGRESFEHDYLN